MSAARYQTSDLDFIESSNFFFDTNILLYLFYSHTVDWASRAYSSLYMRMLNKGMEIYIDNTVLSEFINRVIRIEFDVKMKTDPEYNMPFKKYRDTEEGQYTVNHANNLVKNILKFIQVDGEVMNKLDIQSILIVDSLDYNDKIIEHLCEVKGYILVTNDIDFKQSNIDILSAHRGFYDY